MTVDHPARRPATGNGSATTARLDAQIGHGRDGQRRLGYTGDHAGGVAAFAAERTPKFRGT
jgi:hypothetical protein